MGMDSYGEMSFFPGGLPAMEMDDVFPDGYDEASGPPDMRYFRPYMKKGESPLRFPDRDFVNVDAVPGDCFADECTWDGEGEDDMPPSLDPLDILILQEEVMDLLGDTEDALTLPSPDDWVRDDPNDGDVDLSADIPTPAPRVRNAAYFKVVGGKEIHRYDTMKNSAAGDRGYYCRNGRERTAQKKQFEQQYRLLRGKHIPTDCYGRCALPKTYSKVPNARKNAEE